MFDWLSEVLRSSGYAGIMILAFLENVFPPLPSEIIIPLAGYLARRGELDIVLVVTSGSIGSIAGASFWYWVALKIGERRLKQFVARHGRWLGFNPKDLKRAANWFDRHKYFAILVGRLLPAIRSLISVPAGFAAMAFVPFLLVSLLGTALWTALLAGLGYILGSQHDKVADWLDPVTNVIIGVMVCYYLYRVFWAYERKPE